MLMRTILQRIGRVTSVVVMTTLVSMFAGCSRSPQDLLERDGVLAKTDTTNDNNAITVKTTNPDQIGYQFITEKGKCITVESNNNFKWYVPESYLNMNISAAPIEFATNDNVVVTIGYSGVDTAQKVDGNVYKILYSSMLDNFIQQIGRGDQIRDRLKDSLDMYPKESYKLKDTDYSFDIDRLTVTRSIAAYTYFSDSAVDYYLPCLQASIELDNGEKVVVFAQASTSTGLWDRTVLPTPFELTLGQTFDVTDIKVLEDIQKQCTGYYDKIERHLVEALKLIHLGDLSDSYRLVSLNYTNNYGVDVSRFAKYCFLRLQDGSVYLLYEENNMKCVQFISGDNTHQIPAEWTQFKMEVEDLTDGTIYEFEWEQS